MLRSQAKVVKGQKHQSIFAHACSDHCKAKFDHSASVSTEYKIQNIAWKECEATSSISKTD
jgi:hypothetical protein